MSEYWTEQSPENNLDIIHFFKQGRKMLKCVMSKQVTQDIKMMGIDLNRYIPFVMAKMPPLCVDDWDNYEIILNIDKYGTITPSLNPIYDVDKE